MWKLLRSASPKATQLRAYFAVIVIVLACCCNAEKRVLNDADKTQHVVNKYLETHPARTDTVTSYIPGDTVTSLLVSYDTTVVRDTLNRRDTVKVKETLTKYINRVDTVVKTINNFDLLKECQTGLATSEYERKQAAVDVKAAQVDAGKWKIYFILLCIGVGAFIVLLILKK